MGQSVPISNITRFFEGQEGTAGHGDWGLQIVPEIYSVANSDKRIAITSSCGAPYFCSPASQSYL